MLTILDLIINTIKGTYTTFFMNTKIFNLTIEKMLV
jgi:hypothetical protein